MGIYPGGLTGRSTSTGLTSPVAVESRSGSFLPDFEAVLCGPRRSGYTSGLSVLRSMKSRVFMFFWMAMLALISTAVGLLALYGHPNAEVSFWTNDSIESKRGKIA